MNKVLLLGSHGMAGHMIYKYLFNKGYEIVTAARNSANIILDAEDTKNVERMFDATGDYYDYVINCIGWLYPDSIKYPHKAALLNSWLPKYIEYKLKDTHTKFIHISTDCVFDGLVGNYTERATPSETNAYGRSKALGEVINDKDITFRLSIIGPELKNGSGLLNWVLNNKEDTLTGWYYSWWNGITTLQLAKVIDQYMQNPNVTGLYHICTRTPINKYDLLCTINEVFELNKTIVKTTGPKYTNKVLIDTRNEMDFKIPDYITQLTELKEYMRESNEVYIH